MIFIESLSFSRIEEIITRLEKDEKLQTPTANSTYRSLLIINNDGLQYEKLIEQIPNSLKLGMSQYRQSTTIPLSFLIIQILNSNGIISDIIEIGSGKGYLSRILSNHFNKRLFCVDLNRERLTSSMRVNRLIQADSTKDTFSRFSSSKKRSILEDRIMMSSNMMMFPKRLETGADLAEVVKKSKGFFKIGESKDKIDFNVALVGLHLCGDLIYNTIEQVRWLRSHSGDGGSDCVHIDKIVIVPCCFDKISKFPRSKRLQNVFRHRCPPAIEDPTDQCGALNINRSIPLAFIDFCCYAMEMGASEVSLYYINEESYAVVGQYVSISEA